MDWWNKTRSADYWLQNKQSKTVNEILGARDSQKMMFVTGSMYRQLLFYFLLANRKPTISVDSHCFCARLSYPRCEWKMRPARIWNISRWYTLSLREEIQQTWNSIQNLEFYNNKKHVEYKTRRHLLVLRNDEKEYSLTETVSSLWILFSFILSFADSDPQSLVISFYWRCQVKPGMTKKDRKCTYRTGKEVNLQCSQNAV